MGFLSEEMKKNLCRTIFFLSMKCSRLEVLNHSEREYQVKCFSIQLSGTSASFIYPWEMLESLATFYMLSNVVSFRCLDHSSISKTMVVVTYNLWKVLGFPTCSRAWQSQRFGYTKRNSSFPLLKLGKWSDLSALE